MADYNEFPNIMKRIQDLTRRVRDQETAPRLYAVGVGKGGVRIYGGGSLNVRGGGDINILEGGIIKVDSNGSINIQSGGSLVSDGPAKFTGSANITGNTTIRGNLSIQGNVSFPNGSLDGAFLKNQFSAVSVNGDSGNYSTNFSGSKVAVSKSVPVPSWAKNAYVFCTARGYAAKASYTQKKGYMVSAVVNGSESNQTNMMIYSTNGNNAKASGHISTIKKVSVSGKSSFNVQTKVTQPTKTAGSTGNASVYSLTIFTR